MKLRSHQAEFDRVLAEIERGHACRRVGAIITPGGGKGELPVIASNRLIPSGYADFVAWCVPRLSLAEQAVDVFVADRLGVNVHSHRIRASTNDRNPCRGTNGCVTTHQAITCDTGGTLLEAFLNRRGVLFIDECHHVMEGGPLHRMLQPIVDAAKLTVLMTGNITRGDNARVAYWPYRNGEVDFQASGYRFIRYGRREAIRERAKIPIHFTHADGEARWTDRKGKNFEATTFRTGHGSTPKALFAALQTGYADHLLRQGLADFIEHRSYHDPRAKCLVVCMSQKEARRLKHIAKDMGLRVGIAISDGDDTVTDNALAAIRKFKKVGAGAYDVLITVQMAYEGLDVPPISHLVCLTHIRSWPWIEQMLDRGTRVDYQGLPYDAQRLSAFVPDDPMMLGAIERIRAEQPDAAKDFPRGFGAESQKQAPSPGAELQPVIPISGQVTNTRFTADDGLGMIRIPPEAGRRITEAMLSTGMTGTPLDYVKSFRKLGIPIPPEFVCAPTEPVRQTLPMDASPSPASLEESLLHKVIGDHCRAFDRFKRLQPGTTATQMDRAFGKPAAEMTVLELRQAWSWLQRSSAIPEAK